MSAVSSAPSVQSVPMFLCSSVAALLSSCQSCQRSMAKQMLAATQRSSESWSSLASLVIVGIVRSDGNKKQDISSTQ